MVVYDVVLYTAIRILLSQRENPATENYFSVFFGPIGARTNPQSLP